jgi:hypothetical protein
VLFQDGQVLLDEQVAPPVVRQVAPPTTQVQREQVAP